MTSLNLPDGASPVREAETVDATVSAMGSTNTRGSLPPEGRTVAAGPAGGQRQQGGTEDPRLQGGEPRQQSFPSSYAPAAGTHREKCRGSCSSCIHLVSRARVVRRSEGCSLRIRVIRLLCAAIESSTSAEIQQHVIRH